ncbi:hypothetical protein DSECCO2_324040 [anaerobic digester metagenome]
MADQEVEECVHRDRHGEEAEEDRWERPSREPVGQKDPVADDRRHAPVHHRGGDPPHHHVDDRADTGDFVVSDEDVVLQDREAEPRRHHQHQELLRVPPSEDEQKDEEGKRLQELLDHRGDRHLGYHGGGREEEVQVVVDEIGDCTRGEAPDEKREDPPLFALQEDQEKEEGQRCREVELQDHSIASFVLPSSPIPSSANEIAASGPTTPKSQWGSSTVER